MPNFICHVPEVHIVKVVVEADDIEEALEIAKEVVETGIMKDGTTMQPNLEYDYTLDFDYWKAWEINPNEL